MRLDQFVADVMEQLRDFVPEGGEVRFECTVYPFSREGGQAVVRNFHLDDPGERVSFTVVNHRQTKSFLVQGSCPCSNRSESE